jgi:hypothetical protein
VKRTEVIILGSLAIVGGLSFLACSSSNADPTTQSESCGNGRRDGDEKGIDCGGGCAIACDEFGNNPERPGDPPVGPQGSSPDGGPAVDSGPPPRPDDKIMNGSETDVDCGGTNAPKCAEGKGCLVDADCDVACSYAKKCIVIPSCKAHLGGDTCGEGEVGEGNVHHETCCKSLPVAGFTDAAHPGKAVYLDKYEITAGRIRAWIETLAAQNNGKPDVKGWIVKNRPQIWDQAWEEFLPYDYEGGTKVIKRRLLGDPRVEDGLQSPGPGMVLPPDTDQPRDMGVNHQFNSDVYVDLHGMNCGTWAGAYGSSTYYYPANILARDSQLARADGVTGTGVAISAKDLLDVKSMNCITNAMLAAFCAWDGGQLATDEVLDFVTASPARTTVSGCGTQYDNHGELLNDIYTNTVQTGGRCPAVSLVNATFDAGDALPVPNSPLNRHNYWYPDMGNQDHDKAWQIAAPGRASLANGSQADAIRINAADEPWMDLHGNLNEAALDMSGASFTGKFAIRNRGIGYGSSRSNLNVQLMKDESILRVQRPEAKAAYLGGRCMRFK